MNHPLESLLETASMPTLQDYMRDVIGRRGFDRDDWTKVTVILAEEVGELAKALRKFKDLPLDDPRQKEFPAWVSDEFADVLINLLDLANRFDVSLVRAFLVKERKHIQRFGV